MSRHIQQFVLLCLCILLIAWVVPVPLEAQVPQIRQSRIGHELSPQFPGPHQQVTISLESFSYALERIRIQWYVNETSVVDGVGETEITIQTGAIGERTNIQAHLHFEGLGEPFVKRISVVPSEVNMIWEATDSYAPPFYDGKKLLTREGGVRVVAIPNLTERQSSATDFVYTWEHNGQTIADRSGYNESSFDFRQNRLQRVEELMVQVQSRNGLYNARRFLNLEPTTPQIVFQTGDGQPIEEQSDLAVDGTNTVTIEAVPYFFSVASPNDGSLLYEWRVNGERLGANEEQRNAIDIRKVGDGSGVANISVSIENLSTLLQSAQESITTYITDNE